MKLTFKMTGEEYYSGCRYKFRGGEIGAAALSALLIITFILLIFLYKANVMFLMITAVVIVMDILFLFTQKKSVISQFYSSPIKCSEHTVCLYDEGIELLNCYEKIFSPWQSIYKVRETKEYFIIIMSYSRGVAVINKQKYAGAQLDNIINTIKSKVKVEEGKR